jgi:hypothetical protein
MVAERKAALEFAAELDPEEFADDDEDEDSEGSEQEEENREPVIPESVRLTMEAQSQQILELRNQATAAAVEAAVEKLRHEGLAPAIVEAARPLLGLSDQTIELSNGTEVDAGQAVQGLLDCLVELARNGEAFVKYDIELGRTDETDPIEAQRNKLLDAWEEAAPALD